jgi:hypothetical protein
MALALDATAVVHLERVLPRDLSRMALPDAVARRLGVDSWLLTFGDDGRLRSVTVLGPRPSLGPAEPRPAAPGAALPPLARTFTLPDGGPLARRIGATTATGLQLADLALREPDPDVRADAVRVAVDAAMQDPALERALLEALAAFDDRTLAHAVADAAGEGAAGLMALVAERARGRPLGVRAAAVLRQLAPAP